MKYILIALILLCVGCSESYQAKEITIVTYANDTIYCQDCVYTWDAFEGRIDIRSDRVLHRVAFIGIYSIEIKHE